MSAKAGDRVIRASIDQMVQDARASGRLCDACTGKDNIIDQKDRWIAALEKTLALTQADLHRATDALTATEADLAQERRNSECMHALIIATRRSLEAAEDNKRILSRIIRLGLTPERYHELRAQIIDDEPTHPDIADHPVEYVGAE